MDQDHSASDYRIVVGSPEVAMILSIEPINCGFEVPAGQEFTVVVTGQGEDAIEVTHGPGYVTVWPSPVHSIILLDGDGNAVNLLGY